MKRKLVTGAIIACLLAGNLATAVYAGCSMKVQQTKIADNNVCHGSSSNQAPFYAITYTPNTQTSCTSGVICQVCNTQSPGTGTWTQTWYANATCSSPSTEKPNTGTFQYTVATGYIDCLGCL